MFSSQKNNNTKRVTDASSAAAIVLALAAATGANASVKASTSEGAHGLHFILSADDGTYSGTHEQKYVLERTTITKNFTAEVPFCQSAFVGVINPTSGNAIDALLLTSGIGAVTAALCTQQAAQWAIATYNTQNPFVASYFMGTSGWSPFVGGLNAKDTSPDNDCGVNRTNKATQQRVSIGSVCVSPMSYDYECGIHIERPLEEAAAGECFDREYASTFSRSDLFGKCYYDSVKAGGMKLATDLQKSAGTPAAMDAALAASVNKFWGSMELGKDSPSFFVPTTPFVTSRCGEGVSHSIWIGAQQDYQCRVITGKVLAASGILSHPLMMENPSATSALNDDEDTFVCTSAMEGYGFLSAITRFMPNLPSVIIRGASNYDMYPLYKRAPLSGNASKLVWDQKASYISEQDERVFSNAGYHYAIKTTNDVLLNYLATL